MARNTSKGKLNRTPPNETIAQLLKEINYGCPIQNCCNPYLEFHHFDPPWNVKRHHDPKGMIALCSQHHRAADGGAYTKQQLHELKTRKCTDVSGRFEWRRNDLILLLGGSIFINFTTVIRDDITDKKIIWVNRDEHNNMLLNLDMNALLLEGKRQRLKLHDNVWFLQGNPKEFRCPPSGKEIYATYENGDRLWIRFDEITDKEKLKSICCLPLTEEWLGKTLPLTLVRIDLTIVDRKLKIDSAHGFNYGSSISPGFIFDQNNTPIAAIGLGHI